MSTARPEESLCLIWTSADREVALNMVFMYGGNALRGGWWERVRLIAWGPAQKTLLADQGLQAELRVLADLGVELLACQKCADNYGHTDALRALGVDVQYTGAPLTEMLKTGWKVLTV